ncbi:hypothetical protein VN97_g10900 [Penicillium thymicola]|uniref:Uncharacterized protein n=1 Tax=Penicillium thymicola TaxID=293382 RepID=A0AAI9T8Z6_PENTH|nr:hypothetical protein VN97_g10900 [Penicillium thymicola]
MLAFFLCTFCYFKIGISKKKKKKKKKNTLAGEIIKSLINRVTSCFNVKGFPFLSSPCPGHEAAIPALGTHEFS